MKIFFFESTKSNNSISWCVRWCASDLNLESIALAFCYVNGERLHDDYLVKYIDYIYSMAQMYDQPNFQLCVLDNRYIHCTIDLLIRIFGKPTVLQLAPEVVPLFYPVTEAQPRPASGLPTVTAASSVAQAMNDQNVSEASSNNDQSFPQSLTSSEPKRTESQLKYNLDNCLFYNSDGSFVPASEISAPANSNLSRSSVAQIDYCFKMAEKAFAEASPLQVMSDKNSDAFFDRSHHKVYLKYPKIKKFIGFFHFTKNIDMRSDKKSDTVKTENENSHDSNAIRKY